MVTAPNPTSYGTCRLLKQSLYCVVLFLDVHQEGEHLSRTTTLLIYFLDSSVTGEVDFPSAVIFAHFDVVKSVAETFFH